MDENDWAKMLARCMTVTVTDRWEVGAVVTPEEDGWRADYCDRESTYRLRRGDLGRRWRNRLAMGGGINDGAARGPAD